MGIQIPERTHALKIMIGDNRIDRKIKIRMYSYTLLPSDPKGIRSCTRCSWLSLRYP